VKQAFHKGETLKLTARIHEISIYKTIKLYITGSSCFSFLEIYNSYPSSLRWKEIARVEGLRSTLFPASVKGLKRLVEGGT
jgi:hypothetical protein